MIEAQPGESRARYLMRVAIELIRNDEAIKETTIDYDGTTCDAGCLAGDLEAELDEIK